MSIHIGDWRFDCRLAIDDWRLAIGDSNDDCRCRFDWRLWIVDWSPDYRLVAHWDIPCARPASPRVGGPIANRQSPMANRQSSFVNAFANRQSPITNLQSAVSNLQCDY